MDTNNSPNEFSLLAEENQNEWIEIMNNKDVWNLFNIEDRENNNGTIRFNDLNPEKQKNIAQVIRTKGQIWTLASRWTTQKTVEKLKILNPKINSGGHGNSVSMNTGLNTWTCKEIASLIYNHEQAIKQIIRRRAPEIKQLNKIMRHRITWSGANIIKNIANNNKINKQDSVKQFAKLIKYIFFNENNPESSQDEHGYYNYLFMSLVGTSAINHEEYERIKNLLDSLINQ